LYSKITSEFKNISEYKNICMYLTLYPNYMINSKNWKLKILEFIIFDYNYLLTIINNIIVFKSNE